MSSAGEARFGRAFALRIALWYATLFVLGSIAIIVLTYYLTAASLTQRDRQKIALERTQNNIAKLEVHAPLAGVVAHQNLYRNNSMGHAQEGDQLYQGQAIVSIFDPSEMMVRCAVGEPDGVALAPGAKATVFLDAYPGRKHARVNG